MCSDLKLCEHELPLSVSHFLLKIPIDTPQTKQLKKAGTIHLQLHGLEFAFMGWLTNVLNDLLIKLFIVCKLI